jgi:hypothetical protein
MDFKSLLEDIRKADAERPDWPGEHLIVLGVGLLLLMASGRSRSLLARALVGAAAGAFIGRAASGSGGVARLAALLHRISPQ